MSDIEQYRLAESKAIDARMNDAREAMQTLVAEQRSLIPASSLMPNGFANETPETEALNRAMSALWGVLDLYTDIQYNRMATTMALMDTKQKLERETERANEERERAEEAEYRLGGFI
jgi:hypothetical protein